MFPTTVLQAAMATLLATDPLTIAPAATANRLYLVKAPFTPTPGLDPATLTLADFDGGTPLHAGLGDQQVLNNPGTGGKTIQILAPAGGWHWETTGITNLPQTIYGYVHTDVTGAIAFGSRLLEAPITLTVVGDAVDIDFVRYDTLISNPGLTGP